MCGCLDQCTSTGFLVAFVDGKAVPLLDPHAGETEILAFRDPEASGHAVVEHDRAVHYHLASGEVLIVDLLSAGLPARDGKERASVGASNGDFEPRVLLVDRQLQGVVRRALAVDECATLELAGSSQRHQLVRGSAGVQHDGFR